MFKTIRHQHTIMANQEVEWFSTDDQDIFNKIMNDPAKRKVLEENGWDKKQFTYKFNSHGFRSDEFSNEDSIMFLGDSYVFGTGVPNEVTWTYLVSQELKLRNFNLGISGGSNDTSFRLAEHYIPQLKPKIIVHLTSFADRVELLTEDVVYTMLHNGFYLPERYMSFYKDWITTEENGLSNMKKNIYGIRYICQMHGIKLIEARNQDYWEIPKRPSGNIARDLFHAGPDVHRIIANDILKMVTVGGLEPPTCGL